MKLTAKQFAKLNRLQEEYGDDLDKFQDEVMKFILKEVCRCLDTEAVAILREEFCLEI